MDDIYLDVLRKTGTSDAGQVAKAGAWAANRIAELEAANKDLSQIAASYRAKLDKVEGLPRYAVLGGKERRCLHGNRAKDSATGETSQLYIRYDELTEALK